MFHTEKSAREFDKFIGSFILAVSLKLKNRFKVNS